MIVPVLSLLTEGATYAGLIGALLAWWLVRGMAPALTGCLSMLVLMFAGYLLVEWCYALGLLSPAWYSLGRKVPGRLLPACAVWWFVGVTARHAWRKAVTQPPGRA